MNKQEVVAAKSAFIEKRKMEKAQKPILVERGLISYALWEESRILID